MSGVRLKAIQLSWLGPELSYLVLDLSGFKRCLFLVKVLVVFMASLGSPAAMQHITYVESSFLVIMKFVIIYLFTVRDY